MSSRHSVDSSYVAIKNIGTINTSKTNEKKTLSERDTNIMNFSKENTSLSLLSRLEHRLNMNDLEELQEAFEKKSDAQDEELKLTKSEFAEFLSSTLLTKGSQKEYDELFENIDVSKSGFVTWDKFASYIMLMLYETDDRNKAYSIPNWKPVKNITNLHRDSIKKIQFVKNLNYYISISKEGCCCIFDNVVNMINNAKISSDACRAKDLWVTDFVIMPNVNKIAVSFTTKEIEIYDCSKLDFITQFRITNLNATALCLDYWYDQNNDNDAILIWGDTNGFIHSIHFNSAKIALFERPSAGTENDKQDICLPVNINDIKDKYKNATYTHYRAHPSWVKQVKWAKHLECIISCCASDKESVNLGWFEKTNSQIRVSKFDVPQGGVNAFDYDEKFNLIATANVNSHINLYNPYVQDANGILKGHMRSVISVKFVQSRGQLISFSKDKVLRIWNIHLQMCIQRIANIFPKGADVDITCTFDETYGRLFTTFRNTILMLEIKPEIKDRVMTHNKPVVAAKLNKINNQVISLSQDGTLIMWLIESGQKIKTFTELHGPAEVTCFEFDESNTKFFTGCTDGTIKIWDFNGHCYHTLDNGHSAEITQVLPLKRRIIAVGWTKHVTAFRENMFTDHKVKPAEWKGKQEHEEDILCTAVMKAQPLMLATASFDGDIVLWNSVTELPSKHLNARRRVIVAKKSETDALKKEMTMSSLKSGRTTAKNSRVIARKSAKSEGNNLTINTENDFSCAVTCLRFLHTRSQHKDSTLVSCGGNGWVRFWDIITSNLCAEFVAHTQASSIIMEIDPSEQYLATGDINGTVNIWNIHEYCRNIHLKEKQPILTSPPPLIRTIVSHTDAINSMDLFKKKDVTFIVIASADCSVSLHTIDGIKIGVFGQDEHWKIENVFIPQPTIEQIEIENRKAADTKETTHNTQSTDNFIMDSLQTNNENDYSLIEEQGLVNKLNSRLKFEETYLFDDDALVKNPHLRYNPWSKTILDGIKYFENKVSSKRRTGRSYQEARVQKRDRKQPGTIATEEWITWEKTGQTPGGLYGSLQTASIPSAHEIKEPQKPDFIINPHRYFRDRDAIRLTDAERNIPTLAETLNSAFDEKTLFPKYILDYEARMRQEHKKILDSLASGAIEPQTSVFGRKKRNSSASIFQ